MRCLVRFTRLPGLHPALRWALAILLSGMAGLAVGRVVKGSISGFVSVVDGDSMAPAYSSGSRVYSAPITTPLARGDVVLVDDAHADYALKRIVALPGESVRLWRGQVFIDGKMLREPYLPRHTFTLPDERSGVQIFKLQADQYFVLGDNRLWSIDSRAYGPVDCARIKSRVPVPPETLQAEFTPYALPASGQRMIRAL